MALEELALFLREVQNSAKFNDCKNYRCGDTFQIEKTEKLAKSKKKRKVLRINSNYLLFLKETRKKAIILKKKGFRRRF